MSPNAEVDDLAKVLAATPAVQRFKSEVESLCVALQRGLIADAWAWSIEVCGRTWQHTQVIRVHLHLWMAVPSGNVEAKLLVFRNSRPMSSHDLALGFGMSVKSRAAGQEFAGCFYTQVEQRGTVFREATKQPWIDFVVKDTWVTSLYIGQKISAQVAEESYLKCVVRAELNIKQLRFVEDAKRDLRARLLRQKVEEKLRAGQKRFRQIPLVTAWQQQFADDLDRYRFLVLDGPSRQGKTRFAESLVAANRWFYCDCSACVIPDLRQFRRDEHDLILFDEMKASSAIVIKKVLQASNDVCSLGSSPTQQHVYSVWA